MEDKDEDKDEVKVEEKEDAKEKETESKDGRGEPPLLFSVLNIPQEYHSLDLRNFFSEFLESDGFICCHYIHRPQQCRSLPGGEGEEKGAEAEAALGTQRKRFCCLALVDASRGTEFAANYDRKLWLTRKGRTMFSRCYILRVKATDEVSNSRVATLDQLILPKGGPQSSKDSSDTHRVSSLRDLNPPRDVLPKGNVGTPTKAFLELIRTCRLPPPLINKLQLNFPKSLRKRIYSNVAFNYKTPIKSYQAVDKVRSVHGNILSEQPVKRKKESKHKPTKRRSGGDQSEKEEEEAEEDWERHEALHDDVTEQGRTKERLFEQEQEVVWEKGSSGLVFYTDAQYWDQEEGDFDERTADDWDVDMSVYSDNGKASTLCGDKDAVDLLQLRREMRLREGREESSDEEPVEPTPKKIKERKIERERSRIPKIGYFEKYTKGFGRRIMEKQGWKDGAGLGKTIVGRPDPVEDVGQKPSDKRGFGYRGEKLVSFGRSRPPGTPEILPSKR